GAVALLAERLDALAAAEPPLSRRLLRLLARRPPGSDLLAAACSAGPVLAAGERNYVDRRRTRLRVHCCDDGNFLRPHGAADRDAGLEDPAHSRPLQHIVSFH